MCLIDLIKQTEKKLMLCILPMLCVFVVLSIHGVCHLTMVNQPNSNDEVVKCVVVGDSGVGKTCLVCAFACNTHYDLKKLVRTHVATVWAIDHYQRDREVSIFFYNLLDLVVVDFFIICRC